MDPISVEQLGRLMEPPGGKCVSVFLPTHRSGSQEDPIRLKNLLRKAGEELEAAGLRAAEARRIIEPAQTLVADGLFWSHQEDGLALFLAQGRMDSYRIPLRLEELAVAGSRFHLKPLLPLFRGGRFYVLAVDQKKVRLFRGNRFGIGEIEPKGIPAGIAETLKHEATERHYKFRTPIEAVSGAGRRAAPFHGHGQGPGPDDAKEKIRRYLHQVDAGLRQTLNGDRAPLVLAGVGYELDLYREVSSFPALVEEGIEGNPQGLSGEELRKRAWAIVEPRFRKAEEDAANRYREGTARGRTSEDLTEIIAAARAGRTELLFTALDHQVWGTYDRDSGAIQIHDGHLPGDEDLLDLAALLTLATNGAVHAVPAERLPGASPACVLLRY